MPEERVAGTRDGRRGRRTARLQTRHRHRARFLPRGSRRGRPRRRSRVRASPGIVLDGRVLSRACFRRDRAGARAVRRRGRVRPRVAPGEVPERGHRRTGVEARPGGSRGGRVRGFVFESRRRQSRSVEQAPPLTRVDLDALAATIRRFRSADAAMFGCRRGAYAHSAAGALAHALDGYRAVLASCPAATADSTSSDPTEHETPPRSSTVVVVVVVRGHPRDRGGGTRRGSQRTRGFEPGGGAGFVGVVSASCVLAVGGVAFCVARYLQTRRDRSVRGPWRKMDDAGGDLGRPPRVPPSGSGPGGRAPFAFSARRFYRHLQAGSVGDLPLVEDLDRASGVSTESEGNDRVGTPPLRMGNVVDLPSPRTNRRSNSISEPATRPPPRLRPTIWSSGVSPGASASRSPGTRRGTPPRTTACGAWGSSG